MTHPWRSAVWEVIKTSVISLPIAAILFLFVHPKNTGFAARIDGSCSGWTAPSVALHMTADLFSWWAFVAISMAVAQFHPVMNRVRSASVTVALISAIFFSCGGVHLLDAWATVWAAYWFTGVFKAIAAIIGICGAVFITHDLRVARRLVERDRAELERHRRQQNEG